MTIGLRISEADEDEGMDASIHGEGTSSLKNIHEIYLQTS